MSFGFSKIAVKVGSNVLTNADGTIDSHRIQNLVQQIAELHSAGVQVILISSGAVAYGRDAIKLKQKLDPVSSRQLYSAIGQVRLINRYSEEFLKHGIICGQVLTMKENFSGRKQYLNQKNCISTLLQQGVIPVVNENDTTSLTELMFTDNDELSGLIATMMDAQALIILSNIDGIYDGDPFDPSSSVIRTVQHGKNINQYIQKSKSSFGRGGMRTKTAIARKVANEGITVVIANGKRDGILLDLMRQPSDVECTTFLPSTHISGVKKWIAHSQDFSKGEVHVNEGAAQAILSDKPSSLLFVGVTDIVGNFMPGDIVKIISPDKSELAVGKAQYSSDKARQLIGKKAARPLVHCDYLLPLGQLL